jgi:hypothetical protein
MQSAILNSDSKSDLKLLLDLAKKLGIQSHVLTETEIEEMGLVNAITRERTGEFVDTNAFIKKLKK